MKTKQVAYIVDVDGTLAVRGDRGVYDFARAGEDLLNQDVFDVIDSLPLSAGIIIVSGRPDTYRDVTEAWLDEHEVPNDAVFMRPARDQRGDDVVKEEIYRTQIEPYFDVRGVFDDRDRVVAMWRRLGLTVFQVAPGDF